MEDFDFIKEDAPIKVDQQSKQEEKEFENADRRRKERIRNVFNAIFIWFIRTAAILIILVLIVRVTHIIMPDCWRWLSSEDISQMDKFLFSSALGGVVGKYFENIINNNGIRHN